MIGSPLVDGETSLSGISQGKKDGMEGERLDDWCLKPIDREQHLLLLKHNLWQEMVSC